MHFIKKDLQKYSLILIVVVVSIALIAWVFYLTQLNSTNSSLKQDAIPQKTESDFTSEDNDPEQSYEITIKDREKPCENLDMHSPATPIGLKKVFFEQRVDKLDEQLKFGEISKKEYKSLKKQAKNNVNQFIKNQNIELWNKELKDAKEKHNASIIHGDKENCFDDYFLNSKELLL